MALVSCKSTIWIPPIRLTFERLAAAAEATELRERWRRRSLDKHGVSNEQGGVDKEIIHSKYTKREQFYQLGSDDNKQVEALCVHLPVDWTTSIHTSTSVHWRLDFIPLTNSSGFSACGVTKLKSISKTMNFTWLSVSSRSPYRLNPGLSLPNFQRIWLPSIDHHRISASEGRPCASILTLS